MRQLDNSGGNKSRRVLMCSPDYYDVAYSINPWMDPTNRPQGSLSWQQWEGLRKIYSDKLGLTITTISQGEGLPDMVFTANAGLVHQGQFVVSRFRYPQRRPESKLFADWFAQQGYQVMWPPEGAFFEGAGEARFCGDILLAGYGFRSSLEGHVFLKRILGVEVVSLELVDPRLYHLDLALFVLDDETVVYYPGAFSKESQSRLKKAVKKVIAVERDEALKFACNATVVDKTVVLTRGAVRLPQQLRELGHTVIEAELSEFIKAGGGVRCLTLEI